MSFGQSRRAMSETLSASSSPTALTCCSDLCGVKAGLVHDGDDAVMRRVDELADDPVVEVLHRRPLYALARVLLLLLFQHQLWNYIVQRP